MSKTPVPPFLQTALRPQAHGEVRGAASSGPEDTGSTSAHKAACAPLPARGALHSGNGGAQ